MIEKIDKLYENWKNLVISEDANIGEYGDGNSWISPDGIWYKIQITKHNLFAIAVLKSMGINITSQKAKNKLIEMNWICLEFGYIGMPLIQGQEKMTIEQYYRIYSVLKDQYFFGYKTITDYWKESINYINENLI